MVDARTAAELIKAHLFYERKRQLHTHQVPAPA